MEGTVASVPPMGGRKHPHQEFIQIDTTNILFICGGAFDGLEKIIADRVGKKTLGFGAEIESKHEMDVSALLKQVAPQDFLKFGLIPEFIGRLPIVAKLEKLDKKALIKILTEPKNALVKQYQSLLKMDNVTLRFDKAAVEAIADMALKRNTGARGLRSIIEETMTEMMYSIPSQADVKECVIHKECITDGVEPELIREKAS